MKNKNQLRYRFLKFLGHDYFFWLLITLFLGFIIYILFIKGRLWLGTSDSAQRLIMALDYKTFEPFKKLFSKQSLTSIWPPGHELINKFLLYTFHPFFKEGSIELVIISYHAISLFFWSIGILGFAESAKEILGKVYFKLAILLLISSNLLLAYSYTGMTEVFVFSFLGLSYCCVIKGIKKRNKALLYLSSLLLLFSSFFRVEVSIFILAYTIYLWLSVKKIDVVILFFLSSASYTILKFTYSLLIDIKNPYNFLNFNIAVLASVRHT